MQKNRRRTARTTAIFITGRILGLMNDTAMCKIRLDAAKDLIISRRYNNLSKEVRTGADDQPAAGKRVNWRASSDWRGPVRRAGADGTALIRTDACPPPNIGQALHGSSVRAAGGWSDAPARNNTMVRCKKNLCGGDLTRPFYKQTARFTWSPTQGVRLLPQIAALLSRD